MRQFSVEMLHMTHAFRDLLAQMLEQPHGSLLHSIDDPPVRYAARAGVARIDYFFERLHDFCRVLARWERHSIKVMNLWRRFVVRSGNAFHNAGEPVLARRNIQLVHVHSPVDVNGYVDTKPSQSQRRISCKKTDSAVSLHAMRKSFNLQFGNGRTLKLGESTIVVGVLNVTPDSFSDGGQHFDAARAIEHALQMESDGADIVEVGGESTRPGAPGLSANEEMARISPVLRELGKRLRVPI